MNLASFAADVALQALTLAQLYKLALLKVVQ